ncbi:MAG TPA: flavodoxin domain-containing protein [Streptosporangiaceae bacterium]
MTRILIAYGSKRGATAEIAEWIGAALRDRGLEADVRPAHGVGFVSRYDAVIVGGALYARRWHRDARWFVRHFRSRLEHMPVWLFSSGPLDRTAAEQELPPVPSAAKAAVRIGARGHVTFGGRLTSDAGGFLAAKIAQTNSGDFRDREAVRTWASGIAEELTAEGVPA